MRQPQRDSVRGPVGDVSYLEWPGSPNEVPVVFLHPVNTAAAVWAEVAQEMAGARRAVAVDYRGHGRSASGTSYLPADFAADALAVVDALELDRVHLVGGSIGGAVAIEIAARAPSRVASVAVFGATLHIGLSPAELEPLLSGLAELGVEEWFARHGGEILGPRSRRGATARLVELAGGRDPDLVIEIVRSTFQIADSRATAAALPGPRPPALVAVGTHDPTCPHSMARELAGYLGAQVLTMTGVGHLPMLEVPGEVATLLDDLHTQAASP
ncbi:alpha/beta fold hydrolase [Pseudonocardia hispaniensis]|uniref:Alpha/beta fold hydrolase n=1 Tax=Pseudonocardia hispaniensis TaxID=904933 RepID=A0ABW1J1M0_9PSEU